MLINTFSMQHNIITTLESHSEINFTIEKLNFSKLLINLVFFGYTTGIHPEKIGSYGQLC